MSKQRAASLVAILLFFGVCLSGCSPAAYTSVEGVAGGVTGGILGSGVGYLLGDQVGNMTQNVAVNAGIGAGIGLLGGALLHEHNLKLERKREVVRREAELIDENQRELDGLRQQIDDSSSWGGNEVKPWNERYPASDMELPYQGPSVYLRRR